MYVLDYDQPRCEACRWWMTDGSGSVGVCYRHPPQPAQLMPNANGHGMDWVPSPRPMVDASDFCGEHQAAPQTNT